MLENVFYLENKGLLGAGNYDVLRKIFSDVNEALLEIDAVSKLIENIDHSTTRSTGMHIDLICFKKSLIK